MFDIGGWEFLFIVVIAIVVIGPKDLPGTIRTITGWIRRARELAREFQSGLDDIAQDADIASMKDDLQADMGLDDIANARNSIRNEFEQTIDPQGEIQSAFDDRALPADEDDPLLKDYVDEDEDEELDDIDPKYKTSESGVSTDAGNAGEVPGREEADAAEPTAAETVKKA